MNERTFNAELWQYPGQAAWHFVTLPVELAEEIRLISSGEILRGFGSVQVSVNVGNTHWKTSIFPDKNSKSYLLPIKKQVRTSEQLSAGDNVCVRLMLEL